MMTKTTPCYLLLVPLLLGMSCDGFLFRSTTQQRRTLASRIHVTQDSSSENTTNEAQRLLEKAALLRAEIAAMEGKTVEQVESEARTKREMASQRRQEQDSMTAERKARDAESRKTDGSFLQVPSTFDDMVRQAARAVERAFRDGMTRQTVRFNLVGEDQSAVDENEWPGGAKQMYRVAGGPLTAALLREVRAPTKNLDTYVSERNLVPEIKCQDIWDFDGSALYSAEAKEGASADIQALVFANTDSKYLKDIAEISEAMGPRLFLLVNPFWRNVDSWSFNLLAPNAKQNAQKTIFDHGYHDTYNLMVFSVRGEKCAAIKAYPYPWQLFAFKEDTVNPNMPDSVIRLGSCKDDPTSALMTELLNARPEFQETKTMRQMKNYF